MTVDEALSVLGALTAAYPQANIQKDTAKIYIKFLQDIPYEAGQSAALDLIAKSKWFPTISELRQEAVNRIPGNQFLSAGEAWREVCEQIRKVGHYGIPEFGSEVVAQAVKTMGWRYLCLSENEMADRAHFMKIYETYKERKTSHLLQIPESKHYQEQLIGRGQAQIGDGK